MPCCAWNVWRELLVLLLALRLALLVQQAAVCLRQHAIKAV